MLVACACVDDDVRIACDESTCIDGQVCIDGEVCVSAECDDDIPCQVLSARTTACNEDAACPEGDRCVIGSSCVAVVDENDSCEGLRTSAPSVNADGEELEESIPFCASTTARCNDRVCSL